MAASTSSGWAGAGLVADNLFPGFLHRVARGQHRHHVGFRGGQPAADHVGDGFGGQVRGRPKQADALLVQPKPIEVLVGEPVEVVRSRRRLRGPISQGVVEFLDGLHVPDLDSPGGGVCLESDASRKPVGLVVGADVDEQVRVATHRRAEHAPGVVVDTDRADARVTSAFECAPDAGPCASPR